MGENSLSLGLSLELDIIEFKCFQVGKNSLSLDLSLKSQFILTEMQDKSTKRDNQLNLLTPMSKASNASNGIRDKTKVKASTDIFSYLNSLSSQFSCQNVPYCWLFRNLMKINDFVKEFVFSTNATKNIDNCVDKNLYNRFTKTLKILVGAKRAHLLCRNTVTLHWPLESGLDEWTKNHWKPMWGRTVDVK